MAEITLYGDIGETLWGGITDNDVKGMLQEHGPGDLTVRINSGGGEVFAGVAIYNMLKEHEGNVAVIVDGWAASIASVIALAGDTVEMREAATFMIHKPRGMVAGIDDDVHKYADVLTQVGETILDIYAQRVDRDTAREWMAEETWFNGSEALDAGFVDKAATGKVAAFAPSRFAAAYEGTAPAQFSGKIAAAAQQVPQKEPPSDAAWKWQAEARSRQLALKKKG